MSAERKLTPKETLLSILDQAEDDEELERVLAMKDEEVDRDLAAAGFDLDEQRRKGLELQTEFATRAAVRAASRGDRRSPARSVRGRVLRRRFVVLATALPTMVALAAGVILFLRSKEIAPPVAMPSAAPSVTEGPYVPPPELVAKTRKEALVA